jgi:DNA mismatch endonuclease (patch repair protein)
MNNIASSSDLKRVFGLMADIFTKAKRSAVMSAIRSAKNQATEVRLIELFRAYGISGWRRGMKLAGRPDFVFRNARVAIFVDGCFWHGCPRHAQLPASNRAYWLPKLRNNVERDRRANRILRRNGWRVARIWQHELKCPRKVLRRIKRLLNNS